MVDFQGQWSHQLTTLEAEISTLIRQLGEFRKGTQLPIPRAEGAGAASQASGGAEAGSAPPVGPRLASAATVPRRP